MFSLDKTVHTKVANIFLNAFVWSKMADSDKLIIALDPAPPYLLPGQNVTGRLIVHSLKGVETKGLTVSLHGRIRVHWSVERRQNKKVGTRGMTHSYYTIHFRDREDLFHLTQPLISGVEALPPGDTSFPFSFKLPENIPASIQVVQDSGIEYYVTASLEPHNVKEKDWFTKKPILVMVIFDLRPFPELAKPAEFYTEQSMSGCWCCKGKPVRVWCNLEKTGFYAGETIQFRVRIENLSGSKFYSMSARLKQVSVMRVQVHVWHQENTIEKVFRPEDLPIPPRGEDFWQGELKIPEVLPPTGLGAPERMYGQQPLISMKYVLKIVLHAKGCCKRNPVVSCDITIGFFPPPPFQ